MSQSPLGVSENPPLLVLTSLRESHPFKERRIILNEVIKVGRSVARLKPAPNNAIFDCKVLSRNHALIWYQDGKFWLRDTNSSNGTFVNNTRVIKKVGEEFSDRELFSGDIIRFGVDVVERDTTHGCIIAQVTLYLGNGCEAKPNVDQTEVVNGMVGVNAFHSEQVFLLFHLANEALYREQSLVDKLDELKGLVWHIRKISETDWQAMLKEERLLEKLALYESQLSMLKEDLPQDSLQNQLCQVLEDKMNLEQASKIMLARILNEKKDAMSEAAHLKNSLNDSERECARLREVCEQTQEAYKSINKEFRTKMSELEHLEQQLKTVTTEKEELESQLKERMKEAEVMQDVMSNMKPTMKNRFTKAPSSNVDDMMADPVPAVNGLENGPTSYTEQPNDKADNVGRLEAMKQRVNATPEEVVVNELNELDRLCEAEELGNSEADLEQMLDSTSDCGSVHLSDSVRQFRQSMQLIRSLQNELSTLAELKCDVIREVKTDTSTSSAVSCDTSAPSLNPEPDVPNQSDDVSSQFDQNSTDEKRFSMALDRARQFIACLATYQARAELNLNRYCAQQTRANATRVCQTSGDVCTSPPSNTDESERDFEKTEEIIAEPKPTPLSAHIPTETQLPTNSENDRVESSVNKDEVARLRHELLQALSECENFKQRALEYQKQDASKTELLMSVRGECDALRSRIAQIESEVATSRDDHQRLVAEARRARSEADDLRQERDSLSLQVANSHRQLEQLRATLADTLIRTKGSAPQPNSATNSTSADSGLVSPSQSTTDVVQRTAVPIESSTNPATRNSEVMVHSAPAPLGMTPLFAIIPVMVLLCAVMIFIFSKFAG